MRVALKLCFQHILSDDTAARTAAHVLKLTEPHN